MIRNAAVDGLIAFSLPKNDVTLEAIKERGLPMVIIDQPRLPNVPLVGIDERASARACAEHLRALGHQRFAIVTFRLGADGHCGYIERNRVESSRYELNRVRVSTFLDVLDKGGPEVSVKIWEWHRSNEEGGRIAGENLLKDHPRPTAILATSDLLAIGVIEAARACQVRVPQDLAVTGFDDIPAAKLITPAAHDDTPAYRGKGTSGGGSASGGRRAIANNGAHKAYYPTIFGSRQSGLHS